MYEQRYSISKKKEYIFFKKPNIYTTGSKKYRVINRLTQGIFKIV